MTSLPITVLAYPPEAFTGTGRLLADAVCLKTGSRWAHIGGMLGDTYYEADFLSGVIKLPKAVPGGVPIFTGETTADTVIAFADAQVGKPYDLAAIRGFVFGTSEDERTASGRWICSELWTAILRQAGIPVLLPKPAWEIAPHDLVASLAPHLV